MELPVPPVYSGNYDEIAQQASGASFNLSAPAEAANGDFLVGLSRKEAKSAPQRDMAIIIERGQVTLQAADGQLWNAKVRASYEDENGVLRQAFHTVFTGSIAELVLCQTEQMNPLNEHAWTGSVKESPQSVASEAAYATLLSRVSNFAIRELQKRDGQ